MSSGFVTESEIAEARKKRQEEWEKVRQPDEPLEMPEEPYDGRSLFERLKEQKDKKDLEFEEAHKLKNLIRGLDDDEINFLDIIDKAKLDAEKKKQMQENNEMLEFRQRVATLHEQSIEQKINKEATATLKPKTTKQPSRPSQKSILAGAVRKRVANNSSNDNADDVPAKVAKVEDNNASTNEKSPANSDTKSNEQANSSTAKKIDLSVHNAGALKCIGILPGIGKYRDSSDSEKSTDTDEDYDFSDFDWVGRKVKKCNDDGCDD